MKLNRNHYLLIGILLLLFGAQFRLVESYVLNEPVSAFLAQRFGTKAENAAFTVASWIPSSQEPQLRRVTPPKFVGWGLLSAGGILVLQSLAMRKPDAAPK